jgi:hypothetical protein
VTQAPAGFMSAASIPSPAPGETTVWPQVLSHRNLFWLVQPNPRLLLAAARSASPGGAAEGIFLDRPRRLAAARPQQKRRALGGPRGFPHRRDGMSGVGGGIRLGWEALLRAKVVRCAKRRASTSS